LDQLQGQLEAKRTSLNKHRGTGTTATLKHKKHWHCGENREKKRMSKYLGVQSCVHR